MKFSDVIKKILSSSAYPMSPQEIKDKVKANYPEFFGTPSHRRNVQKGHYKDLGHALLAQIYTLIGSSPDFFCDKSIKPMRISISETAQHKHQPSISLSGSIDKIKARSYEDKIKEILTYAEKYHDTYYVAETFRGPSLYFHQRALSTRNDPASSIHLEYVYATLASWGMHRMGRGGSKMQSFDALLQSIKTLKNKILKAQTFDFQKMDNNSWTILKEIFYAIKVMASGTTIVGNSKVMHHMLPNIIPPIDREYTLWFLKGNTNINNDLEQECLLMKEIISQFFIPIASEAVFYLKAKQWVDKQEKYPWDTSVFKVVDNLVIGAKKFKKGQ